jgi:hypothetical protein
MPPPMKPRLVAPPSAAVDAIPPPRAARAAAPAPKAKPPPGRPAVKPKPKPAQVAQQYKEYDFNYNPRNDSVYSKRETNAAPPPKPKLKKLQVNKPAPPTPAAEEEYYNQYTSQDNQFPSAAPPEMNPEYYYQGGYNDQGYYDQTQQQYDDGNQGYYDQYGNAQYDQSYGQYDQTGQYYGGEESAYVEQGQFAQVDDDTSSYNQSGTFSVKGGPFAMKLTPIKNAGKTQTPLVKGQSAATVTGALLGEGRFSSKTSFKDIPFLAVFGLHMAGKFLSSLSDI